MNIHDKDALRHEVKTFYAVFALSQFLIDSSIWAFYLTEYRGFSLTHAVAFQAATSAVTGLLDLPTGSWADRFGRKRVVMLGFFARALAAALMMVTSSTPMLIVIAIVNGFGWAQISGAPEAFLHDNLKARGEADNFRRHMSTAVMINYCTRTAAFALSGALFTLHPTLPYLTLTVALVLGALCTASIQELPFERTSAATDRAHVMQGVRVFLGNPAFLRVALLMLIGFVVLEQLWLSFQPLLKAAALRPFAVGLSYALGALGSVVGAWTGKGLVVRHRDAFAYCLALGLCGFGGLLFAAGTAPVPVVVAQLITCIGYGVLATCRGSILNAHLPSAHRAVCLSLFSTTEAILVGVVGASLGYLYENFNRAGPPLVVTIACLVLAPATYRALAHPTAVPGESR
jgi:MFS family permease